MKNFLKKLAGDATIKTKLWFGALLVLLVAAVVLLNVAVSMLAQRYTLSFDLTANSAYRLGDESKELLANLTKQVDIYVLGNENYFSGNSYVVQAGKILEEYPKHSANVSLSYVDYESDPSFAASYPDLSLANGNILVTCGDEVKQVLVSNLFNYEYTADGSLAIASSRAEEAVTSAILYVISDDIVKVGVLTGNGVTEVKSLELILRDNNFDVTELNMVSDSFDDCDVLLLAAPTSDLSEDVLAKLDAFLQNGGKYGRTLLYSASVTQPALPNLAVFLSEWGLSVDDGSVFESKAERTYSYQPYFPIAQYADNEYTDMLKDKNSPLLMPLSKPISTLFEFKDNHFTETLLTFSDTAGVRPSDADDTFTSGDSERWGPMPAMVLATYKADGMQSNVLLCASTVMFDASYMQNTSLTNSEFMTNLLSRLNNREQSVGISSKTLVGTSLGVTSAQTTRLGIVLCAVVPLAILAAGVSVWLRRRFK